MFHCYLCPSDEWTTTGLCSICHEIKEYVLNKSSKEVLEILKEVERINEASKEITNNDMVIDEPPTRELDFNNPYKGYSLRKGKKKSYSTMVKEGYNIKI